MTYQYHVRVLEELARHGLKPAADTSPDKYEIRRLRSELLAGRIVRKNYASHVVALRKRYWLLSVPVQLWLVE